MLMASGTGPLDGGYKLAPSKYYLVPKDRFKRMASIHLYEGNSEFMESGNIYTYFDTENFLKSMHRRGLSQVYGDAFWVGQGWYCGAMD